MTERQEDEDRDDSGLEPEDEAPATPFDHPLFLPVLLGAGAVWFGYDGWFNPEMEEHRSFNQWGFLVLVVLTAYYGFKAKKELDADREAAARILPESDRES